MDSRPLVLITDAPLDAHTTELLRGFDPSDEVVGAEGSAADALRSWSQAARRCSGRLVIVDSRMHAEQQALANLLDVPGRGTSVLLAHNGDDSVDVPINVADGYVVPRGGTKLQAAGILVVSAHDCPAFANATAQAAAEVEKGRNGTAGAWETALDIVARFPGVEAVEAAPFCASCAPMELPASSEDDRRLRASAAADDDLLTRLVLRPFSRRLTKALEPTGRPSTAVIRLGLALGIAAALLAMPGNAVTSIASGIALLASSVAMLSAGEVVRYRRRPDFTGARWHRLASRVVEGAFVLGLGIGAARAGEPQWLLATAAVGLLVVMGNAIAGRAMVTGNTASDHRSLRWSAIAIALIVAGPGWALLAAALGALVILGLLAMRARADESTPDVQVPPSARFLTPLGALVDAGLPVRVISGAVGDRYVPLAGRLLTAGVAFVAVAVAWSWSDQGWPLVVAALVWLVLSGLALGTAPAGTAAWATPAALRAVEVVMLMAAASTLPGRLASPPRWSCSGCTCPPWR